MVKRFCDRCGKPMNKRFFYVSVTEHLSSSICMGPDYCFEICPECFSELFNFSKKKIEPKE